MLTISRQIVLFGVLIWFPSRLAAQANIADFGRPRAVVEHDIKPGENARQFLERVVDAVRKSGFDPTEPIQWSDGYVSAVKKESLTTEHRVVIWLDWRYSSPGKTLAVYLDYARFKKPRGSEWQRDSISLQERSAAIQPMIKNLIAAAGL